MSHGVSTVEEFHGQVWPDGIGVAAMPIGVNHIESVNVYLVEDGDSVTLVDCGMWHPGEPDDGLTKLRDALNVRGYVLDDISRIIVTHAHIDHYGMAGRLMELTGAELLMHAMTDLDCEKYRHPETAQARKRDTYSDHGVPEDELPAYADTLAAWLPYLHSVVEASTRLQGGEIIPTATASGRSSTPRVTPSATSACGHRQTSCCSPAIISCPPSLPRSCSSVVSTKIRCAAIWHRSSWSPSTIPRW